MVFVQHFDLCPGDVLETMRVARVLAWRDFRNAMRMRTMSQFATQSNVTSVTPQALRDEARVLTAAGVILLAIGFPLTMTLVALALAPHGLSPMLPIAAGGPPIVLGYIACHYASQRLARAKALEVR